MIQEPEPKKIPCWMTFGRSGLYPGIKCPFHWLYMEQFSKAVWSQLIQIPMGQTRTYKQIPLMLVHKAQQVLVKPVNQSHSVLIPCPY